MSKKIWFDSKKIELALSKFSDNYFTFYKILNAFVKFPEIKIKMT